LKGLTRSVGLLALAAVAVGILGVKAARDGWLGEARPLDLGEGPLLVFFTLHRGCDCQMDIVYGAEAQLAAWEVPTASGLKVESIDFNQHRQLAKELGVARAPALVLLDQRGEVVWRQDIGLRDQTPLDLITAEARIRELGLPMP